jgi:hypothetical protein
MKVFFFFADIQILNGCFNFHEKFRTNNKREILSIVIQFTTNTLRSIIMNTVFINYVRDNDQIRSSSRHVIYKIYIC